MIITATMYTIICDNCGKDLAEGSDFSCWNEPDFISDSLEESGWHIDGDNHYCPDCFEYDEEDDLIIKKK